MKLKAIKLIATAMAMILACSYVHAKSVIDTPKIKWRYKTEGLIRGDSVIDKSNVYFGSADGYLYSLNIEDGSLNWKFKTGGAIVSAPTIFAKTVVVSSRDGFVYAVNAKSGKARWTFQMKPELEASYAGWQYFTSSPVYADDKIYVGSGDGHLYALNARKGKLIWQYDTHARIRATPLVADGKVYQPSNNGYVYVLDAKTGKEEWRFATQGVEYDPEAFGFDRKSIYAQPVLKGKSLIIAARDGNTYAVDIQTRKQIWNQTYGTTWAMSSAADDDTVFVGWSTNNLLSAHDLASGKERWQFKAKSHNYTTPLLVENVIYFGSADGHLYQLDKLNGKQNWAYDVGQEVHSSPVLDPATNVILLGADNGYFYAIEEAAAVHKAVYQPSNIEGNAQYLLADKKISPYLAERGFQQLGEDELETFIDNRITDGEASVIVFALPLIPPALMGDIPSRGRVREYLRSGGKIVWFGDIPNFYALDTEGNFKRDHTEGSALLDVTFTNPSESGNYYSKATHTGLNWGLPVWFKATGTPVKADDVTPLAYNEFGLVTAWVKKFNARNGSGFVSLRPWSWSVPIREEDLELIHAVAVYGL